MTTRFLVAGTGAGPTTIEVYHQLAKLLSQVSEEDGLPSFSQTDTLSGTTLARAIKDPSAALKEVTISLRSDNSGGVLIKGLQSAPAPSFDVAGWNYDVAANVAAAVILVVEATGLSEELLADEIRTAVRRAAAHHAPVAGVVVVGASANEVSNSDVPVVGLPLTLDSVKKLTGPAKLPVTPIGFQTDLLARASADRRTIVLPEPEDPRVLRAAAKLLADKVANLVLVGEAEQIRQDAEKVGVDISAASIVSVNDPELREKYAEEFARLRAHKGVSLDDARAKLGDVTYFATMMVQMGDADGMVSGAAHTTAETIVPAFQIIKTRPGTSLVSSSFLMLLADHVLVMGDCAVNTNPSSEQLAEIAAETAATAAAFGLDPKVAMLSYSTGSSGSGADVDLVSHATETLMKAHPDLAVEGPIQYDAAVVPEVAASKAPDSEVAGQANVLIFPSLSAGNIAYKAIQRSAGAVAVGPILQGLRRPVNDLSRGATVEDIVNTVAITAVQAQSEESN